MASYDSCSVRLLPSIMDLIACVMCMLLPAFHFTLLLSKSCGRIQKSPCLCQLLAGTRAIKTPAVPPCVSHLIKKAAHSSYRTVIRFCLITGQIPVSSYSITLSGCPRKSIHYVPPFLQSHRLQISVILETYLLLLLNSLLLLDYCHCIWYGGDC